MLLRLKTLGAVLLIAGAAVAGSATPPDVRLPTPSVVVPPPQPAPDVGGSITVGPDELYVIDASRDVIVRSYPAGLMRFTKGKPGVYYSKFAGGTGAVEEREFAGPFVYVGRATGKGRTEIVVTPLGLKSETEIVTALVDAAAAGVAPKPKPKDPDPPVVPVEPKDPLVDATLLSELQTAYTADPAVDKATSLAAFAAAMTKAARTSTDPALGDVGALERRINTDTVTLVGRGKLPALGVAVGKFLVGRLPASGQPTTPLTAELRSQAADAYARVAATLKAVR